MPLTLFAGRQIWVMSGQQGIQGFLERGELSTQFELPLGGQMSPASLGTHQIAAMWMRQVCLREGTRQPDMLIVN